MEEKITLDYIKGYKEEKAAVKNIIDLLNNYNKYEKQGVNIPRGLIFQGPPGTGKTLFAKAIAGECNYNFYTAFNPNTTEEQTIDTIKDIFKKAEENSISTNKPSLIYIDELDKIAYIDDRGNLDSESREIVRFLLQKLDETKFRNKILIIASTNNYRKIPHALLRSGRFDKKFLIDIPDTDSRKEILDLYINNHPLFKEINTYALALKTQGMSGADLKTLINNTLLEYIVNKETIVLDDFIKVINEMNFETIGKKWKNEENALEVLAHEIGHALVSYELTGSCGTVSALKYGNMAGSTDIGDEYTEEFAFEEAPSEKKLNNYTDIVNNIIIALGGKAGEKIYLNQISTGVNGDIDSIYGYFDDLIDTCALGFDYSKSYAPIPNSTGKLGDKIYRKCNYLIKKYYRKAYKIVKKNKSLGLYLIDEIHKNNDVLSNNDLIKRINLFKENKELRSKYSKMSLKGDKIC